MKPKVLIISQHFPPEIGAASQRMSYIANFLNELEYDVTVLTSEPCYPNKELYEDYYNGIVDNYPFEVKRIKSQQKDYSKDKVARIKKYLSFMLSGFSLIWKDKNRYDFVIATSPPIFVGLIGIFAKLRFKSKLYLDLRDLWPESIEGLKVFTKKNIFLRLSYKLEKLIYKFSDCIIINSQAFEEKVREKLKKPRDFIYLPNGVSKEQISLWQEKTRESSSITQVTYAGNLGLAQGLVTIIEAANHLKDKKDIHFNIVGSGVSQDEIMVLAKSYKLTNISFLGAKSRQETMEILANSDIGLIHLIDAKIFETVIPSKIFDYMVHSLPIVAGIGGQGAKVVRESGCGLLSEPEDAEGMANCILSITESDDKGKSFGDKGKAFLLENFVWDNNIQKLHREFSLRRGEKDE